MTSSVARYSLWKKHDSLPEVFDTRAESPTQARDSPLRPELIEAIFYLSLALPGDLQVFEMARSIAQAIDEQSRVACGFASVADVTTKRRGRGRWLRGLARLDNRMDSFFLSETLVYLYLALAPADVPRLQPSATCGAEDLAQALPWPVGAMIFTTEGHLFPLQPGHQVVHRQELFPAALAAPMPTCQASRGLEKPHREALSPFERVAVQQRCRTKYLLTPSYQLQMISETTRRCRPQSVTLLVWAEGQAVQVTGLASSLGRPVPALQAAREAETCAAAEPVERPPAQHLALLRLDLEQSPGRMSRGREGMAGRWTSTSFCGIAWP